MKINKIVLSNIGAYHGHYELDLAITHPKKNLILFGGKNGAGKTTLLESVRIALFGPYMFGLRTESEQYNKKITSLLNKTALAQGEKTFRIILEIDKVENYNRTTYSIKRSWNTEGSKLKESLEVINDGKYLNEREIEIFQTKLREETPPQLFELCLFDGEEIGRIISDNKLPNYLRNSARVLFNLDLFENLENDLSHYMKQTTVDGTENELRHHLEALETIHQTLLDEQNTAQTQIQLLINETNINSEMVEHYKKEFEVHGGLIKEERDSLITRISTIEHQRKTNIENVRSFITGLLPIFLVRDLLFKVKDQMGNEQENESFAYLKQNLTSDKLDKLIETLSKNGINIPGDNTFDELLLNGLLAAIQPADSSLIHRASFNQRSEIETIIKQLVNLDTNEYLTLFNQNQELLKESQMLRKKVDENDKNHDFKDMIDTIHNLNQQIEKSKLEIERLGEVLNEIDLKIEQNDIELGKVKSKILDSTKSENTLTISLKITEISKKFRSLQLRKKLQQVEIEATYMANQLFRKEEFLQQIKINPETFDVVLLSPSGEEIDQFNISAGEKELLLLSIFWAMFKTSGHRLPFIFDTLLGRLDQTHKKRLLTQLIPRCGEQVLILSTDSEIDFDHFSLIQTILSKSYTLDYDKEERRTILYTDQYFDLTGLELKA
jgi:DNA sulfur modification protein DndD